MVNSIKKMKVLEKTHLSNVHLLSLLWILGGNNLGGWEENKLEKWDKVMDVDLE